jgi:hypothetical protein
MNGEESDDSTTILIVGVIFTVLIFFIVIGVIVYFSIDDKGLFGLITSGENSGGTSGRLTQDQRLQQIVDSLTARHNQTINEFNATATENGFQEFVIDMDAQLKPNEISRVEIINSSGVTETVQVCDNNAGFQPLYVGKQLVCSNGMLEVTNNSVDPPLKCCKYDMDFANMPDSIVPETLASHAFNAINTVEGALGFCGNASGAEEECSIPIKYKVMGALLMGAYMKKDWFKDAYKSAKSGLGEEKALATMSDFVSSSVAVKKEVSATAKSTVTKAGKNTKKRAKFKKFKGEFFNVQKKFAEEIQNAQEEARRANAAVNEARESAQAAEEIARLEEHALNVERKVVMKVAAGPGAKLVGKEAFKSLGKILEVDAVVGAACSAAIGWTGVGELACGGLIIAMDIAMIVDMAVALLDECDFGGFQQYQGNDTVILPMRNTLEGQIINEFNAYGETPPFIFSLSGLDMFPTLDTKSDLTDFKDIKEIFNMALEEYEHSIPQFKPDEPSNHNQTSITVAIMDGERVLEEVHRKMYSTINDKPQERDAYIWDYLKTHLNDSNKTPGSNSNELKYIMYEPELTSNKTIAISLNDAGIELFNTEAERLNSKYIPPNEDGTEDSTYKNDPEKIVSPLPLLIKTRYYRTINSVQNQGMSNQSFILQQNELPKPFTIESYSMSLIKAQCTSGMDPDELPNKDALKEHHTQCGMGEKEVHHPSDHGCGKPGEPECYNKDTGLCNTTIGWCEEMGMGLLLERSFTGNGVTEYKVCDTSGVQDIFSFAVSDEGAKYFQRSQS